MNINNVINGNVVFKAIVNGESSFTITPPSAITEVLIVYEALSGAVGATAIVQTAPVSGVFATSGYLSGSLSLVWNSNAVSNQNLTSGLILTKSFTSGVGFSGTVYVTNLNTTQQATSYGLGTDSTGNRISYVGESPTTSTTTIKILPTTSSFNNGIITVYSLL